MPDESQPLFRVVCSDVVARNMAQLLRRAKQEGFGKEVGAALRQIIARLRTDPLEFGETLYHLPALNLEVRAGAIAAVGVRYAVHAEKRLVFIGDCKRLHIADR